MRQVSVRILPIILVIVASIAVVALASNQVRVTPDTSPEDGAGSPAERPVPTAEAPEAVAYGGPRYGLPGSASPTNDTNQSKLWYLDGSWWASMLERGTGQVRIHRLDPSLQAWVDTGVVIDERDFARADVLWGGEHLYVASAGTGDRAGHAVRITRFSYNDETRGFEVDPNFPLTITESGVEAVNVARTASGTVWVSYVDDGRLTLNHTVGGDLVWGEPFSLTVDGDSPEIDQAAMVAVGDNIAVVWTTRTDEVARIAVHIEEAADDEWSSQGIRVSGLSLGEDQLSVTSSERRMTVYAVVRTSIDEEADRNDLAPQLVLLQFPVEGVATGHLVARVDDRHSHPIVVLDADRDELRIVAASGGAIYYKASSLDAISFPSGRGVPIVSANEVDPKVSHPTSTKQPLTAESGLVVLAADRDVGRYYFGVLSAGRTSEAPAAPSAPSDLQLAHDTFDGLQVGAAVGGSWKLNAGPPADLTVAMLTSNESSARLTGGPPGEVLRACRAFPITATGTVIVAVDILLNPLPADETPLVELRGADGELTSIRLRRGVVAYYEGDTRVITALRLEPGTWYRATITADLGARSSGITVSAAGQDDVLLEVANIAWRSEEATDATRVCLAVPGEPELALYADNVRVIATR